MCNPSPQSCRLEQHHGSSVSVRMPFGFRWREFGAPGRPECLEHVHFTRYLRGEEGARLGFESTASSAVKKHADSCSSNGIPDNFSRRNQLESTFKPHIPNFVCDMLGLILSLRTCSIWNIWSPEESSIAKGFQRRTSRYQLVASM